MPKGDSLFLAINQFAVDTPWLHTPARLFASDGILLFELLLVIAWWRGRAMGNRLVAAALLAPVATVVAFGVQQLIVMFVDEARPYAVHPSALVLVSRTTDPSFPSDHACVTAAIAVGLLFANRRLGYAAAIGALLMAVTRLYVGAHWPIDVVAGLLVGALVSWGVMFALRGPATRLVAKLGETALRPLVAAA